MISLGHLYTLSDIVGFVAAKAERGFPYSLYWDDQDRPAMPDDRFLVSDPVRVTGDGVEVYPTLARENGFWIYCSDELIQDVVDLAIEQKPAATTSELIRCIEHYLSNDDFLDLA